MNYTRSLESKMYNIRVTKTAYIELAGIHRYISNAFMSSDTADRQVERIRVSISKLDSLPERYPHYRRIEDTDVRMMPVDNYVVLYSVDNDVEQVNILHIIYKRRNDM